MNNYYFTFGLGGVYRGGWVRILSNSLRDAQTKFKEKYGLAAYKGKCLNYCFAYTEEEFYNTRMIEEGNLGHYEWEVIP